MLSDIHEDIVTINNNAKVPLSHKLTEPISDIHLLHERYKSIVVSIAYTDEQPVGFLLSPILSLPNGEKIVHAGLTMVNSNSGVNLLVTLGCIVNILTFGVYGETYCTNISSTPSIVEGFCEYMHKPWPSPQLCLKRPPSKYREVAQELVDKYVREFFPNPQSVVFDNKRFVLRSESEAMGFNTNIHKISRASNFLYQQFCSTMLDYSKEEDFIQVGKNTRKIALKSAAFRLYQMFLLNRKGKQYV
jgi:hypothetical protein